MRDYVEFYIEDSGEPYSLQSRYMSLIDCKKFLSNNFDFIADYIHVYIMYEDENGDIQQYKKIL